MGSIRGLFLRGTPQDLAPSPEALAADSVAWSELAAFVQTEKYNPDLLIGRKGFGIYKEMMNDEQVKSAVHFKRATVTGRDWHFELDHGKKNIPEEEARRRIDVYTAMIEDGYRGSFTDGLNAVEKSMFQGFSMTEQIFGQYEHDGLTYWGVRELKPKPFDTFFPVVDEMGVAKRWVQKGGSSFKTTPVDLSKFVYYKHNPDMDEHYGRSDLRAAYRAYVSKDIAIRYSNVFLERLAGGFPVAKPTEGRKLVRNSQEWNDLVSIMRNITGKASIILPEGIELEIVQTSGGQVDVFTKMIEFHDLAIAKSLLMPNLLGMSHSGQTGSFSQSETQFDVFMVISDGEARRLEDALNEQVFAPLGRVNFADGVAPRFKFKPLSRRKRQIALETWNKLLTAGGVTATDTDELHVREMLDFPDPGEPIATPEPAAPTRPARSEEPEDGDAPPTPVGRGEEAEERERMSRRSLVDVAAFARAEQRVAFAVIDRQSQARIGEHVPKVDDAMFEMIEDGLAKIEEQDLGSDPSTSVAVGRFDLDGFRARSVATAVRRALRDGLRIGEDHARREVDKARGRADLSRKISMDRLGSLAEEFLKAKSFTISADLRVGAVREIKTVLMNAIKYSWTQREIRKSIYRALASKGYLSGVKVGQALGIDDLRALAEELDLQTGLTPHHLNTVIRTNTFEAINEARFNYFTDPELDGFVRALEYSSILDGRTTQICRALDGRVYASDDALWNTYRPPNHFNCRSLLIPVTKVDEEPLTEEEPGVRPQQGFGG